MAKDERIGIQAWIGAFGFLTTALAIRAAFREIKDIAQRRDGDLASEETRLLRQINARLAQQYPLPTDKTPVEDINYNEIL